MLERALSRTFSNLSTLILVAFVFALPIHLAQAYLFRDVLAVQELAPEISSLPEGRLVRGVDKGDFQAERIALLIAIGIDLLLLPLAYRAAKRVLDVEAAGDIPGVIDAWKHLGSTARPGLSSGPLVITAALGIIAAVLVVLIGDVLAGMASADLAWAVFGLGRATAMGLLVALVAGVAASLPQKTGDTRVPVEKIDLY